MSEERTGLLRRPMLTGTELRVRRLRAGVTLERMKIVGGYSHRAQLSNIEKMAEVPHGMATRYLVALADATVPDDARVLDPA